MIPRAKVVFVFLEGLRVFISIRNAFLSAVTRIRSLSYPQEYHSLPDCSKFHISHSLQTSQSTISSSPTSQFIPSSLRKHIRRTDKSNLSEVQAVMYITYKG